MLFKPSMTAPKDIHEGMLELLTEDEQLLLDLARAVGLSWEGPVTVDVETNSYPLPRALPPNGARPVRGRKRAILRRPIRRRSGHAPYRLTPDRVFSIRDANGQLVGLLILENQLDRDRSKPWRMSGYRASVQIHFEHSAEVLGISPPRTASGCGALAPWSRTRLWCWSSSRSCRYATRRRNGCWTPTPRVRSPRTSGSRSRSNAPAADLEPRSSMQSITLGIRGPGRSCWPP
ncbi:MAG: hypothetical protein HC927_08090 [Deltaproteobacteria bacterium]|nr:hypothetical protein [Deltaproteobacteria bacterium]